MKKKGILFLIPILILLSYACSRPVAEVNGKPITKKDYLVELNEKKLSVGSQIDELTLKNIVIDSMIEERLILEEAKNRGILATKQEIEDRLRTFKAGFKSEDDFRKYLKKLDINEEYLKRKLADKIVIDKFIVSLVDMFSIRLDEIKREYEIKKPVLHPEMVNITMLEFANRDLAERTYKKIMASSFKNVLEELKAENNKSNNKKDLLAISESQWVNPSIFAPDLQKSIKNTPPGRIIGPIEKSSSWYIIKINEKKPARYKTFDEAKTEIMFSLLHTKRLSALRQWLDQKKENSKIIIYDKRL